MLCSNRMAIQITVALQPPEDDIFKDIVRTPRPRLQVITQLDCLAVEVQILLPAYLPFHCFDMSTPTKTQPWKAHWPPEQTDHAAPSHGCPRGTTLYELGDTVSKPRHLDTATVAARKHETQTETQRKPDGEDNLKRYY